MTFAPVTLSTEIIDGPDQATVPVVFVGSLGSDKSMWASQHDALSAHFTCCYVDKRGHGDSPCPSGPYTVEEMACDVVKVLDDNGWDKAHLVGLSLGGAVCQMIALNHPGRVASLALVSTAAKFGTTQAWTDKAAKVRAEGTVSIALDSATRWFTEDYGVRSGNRQKYFDMVSRCPDEGYAASCEALGAFDTRTRLADVTAPTLVISGADDQGTTPEMLQFVAGAIPGAQFESLAPAAHLCNVEQADIFNRVLIRHLTAHS
ncbi:3-oxoadipate enol-lactonase [Corynebacterium mendelii]|uniref:3-oxoadipate enol-lactonase n=1 Tax=Corynebacterium mendelii TaxID=2765362 RepID=A0A939IUC8_9CORY|nr:3-oxoadipate enol-lactonase [Corynebacterium mendelii]MBN9644794.1 3-oxoadipate enol-lactonase [Corynebacterium mendelii]